MARDQLEREFHGCINLRNMFLLSLSETSLNSMKNVYLERSILRYLFIEHSCFLLSGLFAVLLFLYCCLL